MPIHTKWPRLLVVGEPITTDQAAEILIRTNSWYWRTGDPPELTDMLGRFGYPTEEPFRAPVEERMARFQKLMSWIEEMGILGLEYLSNDRISSAWIGGRHGWCNWDGQIGCSAYNIGKWPSDEDLTTEWEDIVAAFPYLDLTCQVLEEEGEGELAAEWRIQNGTVTYNSRPTTQITPPTEVGIDPAIFRGGPPAMTSMAHLLNGLQLTKAAAAARPPRTPNARRTREETP